MAKFVELTVVGAEKIWINMDRVVQIAPYSPTSNFSNFKDEEVGSSLHMSEGEPKIILVREKPARVVELWQR